MKRQTVMAAKSPSDYAENLCEALAGLNDAVSVRAFLEDIASPGEIRAMSQRLEVARLLNESRTYPEIMRETGAGTATISRVKRCLENGAGGYMKVLHGGKNPSA